LTSCQNTLAGGQKFRRVLGLSRTTRALLIL
jgi:hypothetical protein